MATKVVQRAAVEESTDLLLLPVFASSPRLPRSAAAVDRAVGRALSEAMKSGDFTGKKDELLVHRPGASVKAQRVALMGLGEKADFTATTLRWAVSAATQAWKGKARSATLVVDDLPITDRNAVDCAQAAVEGLEMALYRFDRFKDESPHALRKFTLLEGSGRRLKALRSGTRRGEAVGAGVTLARELANLPGNHGTPKVLASEARKAGRKSGFSVKALGPKELEKLGMGSFLSVALGSAEEPRLIVMEWNGGKKGAPTVALVGKGLTFDAGGLSIKPAADMDKMRYDKCGGCAVIGAMVAAARLKLPLRVIGIVPSTENVIGERANKPGDVVKASNGKTIEILNTDAEGRLILADALVHAQTFKPDVVVDLATLTGACMVALGSHCAGLMTTDNSLSRDLVRAGEDTFERVWRLPLWPEYADEMKGETTDLKNLGGRYGGALTAGAFLQSFAGDHRWAHLDIAGVSWDDAVRPWNRSTGATGFGVRLLARFLENVAKGS